jgi:branched-chain amino acid transport system permease protein
MRGRGSTEPPKSAGTGLAGAGAGKRKLIGLGVAVVLLIVLPFAVSGFRTTQLASVGAILIAILGLDILTGANGQVSLGHGAFVAVGAYTTAILVANHGVRDLWTIAAAAGVAGLLGLVAGVPALRLRGLYLALATFGIAVALPTILLKFDHFTGGSTGISFFGSPHETGHGAGVEVLGVHLSNARWLYTLTWVVGVALFLFAWWLLVSRFGRTLRAIRDSEPAAAGAGINRSAYKVAAFGVSAAYAGVAGSLLAINSAYVSPSLFPVQLSLYLLVGAVVGGFGSIWGAMLGALLIQFLPDIVGAIPNVETTRAGPTTFAFGAVLVALMLLQPLLVRLVARVWS